ncbi:MAG: TlyA family RNA methyltransferase [Clostridia bacterium]|nr:TlyA family RNA methyltransferase [Clostridia bacterium]
MQGKRLDNYIVEIGECPSRESAKRLIMAGKVLVNEIVISKGSYIVKDSDLIRIKERQKFVSRGGHKLEKALEVFPVDVSGLSILDIGASTGGFTDCLLQNGAKEICAVDVGYGQLHWSLRNDERVKVLERTNARYITPEILEKKYDAAVCDASFISLKLLLPAIDDCTDDGAFFIGLIKPQFECGKENVGKGGVVKDENVHAETVESVIDYINSNTSFSVLQLDFSPITGPKGNIEFLVFCRKNVKETHINTLQIIKNAHLFFKNTKN